MLHKEINLMSKNNFKMFSDTFLSSAECKWKEEHTIPPAVEKSYPDKSDDLSSKSHLHNGYSNVIDKL